MRIVNWNSLSNDEKKEILRRPKSVNLCDLIKGVKDIIRQIREEGDVAIRSLTSKFDGISLDSFFVDKSEFQQAEVLLNEEVKESLFLAAKQISAFHEAQYPKGICVETIPGVVCEKQIRAIERVGLYVPAGTAPLVSTVLMLGIPAKIADCPLKILCTPPQKDGSVNPNILYAASLCGIDRVYKVGGAQAIAAMAYGTESIPKVDKIFGPGNAWVTQAKLLVAYDSEGAAIDLPAGASEVMVIADDDANPLFVASDLLSQAEHGIDSQVILVCTTKKFSENVFIELEKLLETIPRKEIAKQSLKNSVAIIVDNVVVAIEIANTYAPEHLIIQTKFPRDLLTGINTAGSIFLGQWSPESAGDYASGTNHVLPTTGFARSINGLGVEDFMLKMSVQELSQEGLRSIATAIQTLAEVEKLEAHALAVKVRVSQ